MGCSRGICAKVLLTWSHILGLYRDIYTAFKKMSLMGSSWLLDQDNASSHSACAITVWFRRNRVNVLDWPTCSPDLSPIENV